MDKKFIIALALIFFFLGFGTHFLYEKVFGETDRLERTIKVQNSTIKNLSDFNNDLSKQLSECGK